MERLRVTPEGERKLKIGAAVLALLGLGGVCLGFYSRRGSDQNAFLVESTKFMPKPLAESPSQSSIISQTKRCPDGYIENTMTQACYFLVVGEDGRIGVDPLVEGQSPSWNTLTGGIVVLGPDSGGLNDLIYVDLVIDGEVIRVLVSEHAWWKFNSGIGVAEIDAIFPVE